MKFLIYHDTKKKLRWRLIARNGRIIADSGESYETKRAVRAGIALVKRLKANTPVESTAHSGTAGHSLEGDRVPDLPTTR